MKSDWRWDEDKNELRYCDTVFLFDWMVDVVILSVVVIGRLSITGSSECEIDVLEEEKSSAEDWSSDDRDDVE